jgi:hypothetical protein
MIEKVKQILKCDQFVTQTIIFFEIQNLNDLISKRNDKV